MGAEKGRQKSLPKRGNVGRDQNRGIEWPKVPAETPYLGSCQKPAVYEGWMVEVIGLELATHHLIEPVSAASCVRHSAEGRR